MSLVGRTFSDERGLGPFHSLGVLPRRTREKSPVFHIAHDDNDDDDNDDHSSFVDDHHPPADVPFPPPRSASPPSSGESSSSSSTPTPRPRLSRGTSSPILLSNGKPLKSSLKSYSSSPAMLIPPQAPHMHLRARSEPAHKNVHFPERDYGLATVRVFNRSARPASLSSPSNGNGDETETEGEDTPPPHFPFPSLSPVLSYEVDPGKSSPVPSKSSPSNLLLESLHLLQSSIASTASSMKPFLTGSILVRNLAFEKHVAIRFTLDDWQTVSEVGAHYVGSLPYLPSNLPSPSPSSPSDTNPQRGRGWDRFRFTIRLEDYAHSLSTRTLWFAARYHIKSSYPEPGSSLYGPGGEWWDNNDGRNYRVGFRAAISTSTLSRTRPRRETISVPISSSSSRPEPPMACNEHALGLLVQSFSNSKEDRRLTPLQAGKLDLCNYAPPAARAISSISLPFVNSHQALLSPSLTKVALPPSSDEDTSSPTSSILSTPSVSPTIVPRIIIGGQPATPMYNTSDEMDFNPKPSHITDWDWSAAGKPQADGSSRQHNSPVPVSERPRRQWEIPSPSGRRGPSDGNVLYNAFVTQWCFAQGPSPGHHTYDGGGIMT